MSTEARRTTLEMLVLIVAALERCRSSQCEEDVVPFGENIEH